VRAQPGRRFRRPIFAQRRRQRVQFAPAFAQKRLEFRAGPLEAAAALVCGTTRFLLRLRPRAPGLDALARGGVPLLGQRHPLFLDPLNHAAEIRLFARQIPSRALDDPGR
jgi:hypothetical protein